MNLFAQVPDVGVRCDMSVLPSARVLQLSPGFAKSLDLEILNMEQKTLQTQTEARDSGTGYKILKGSATFSNPVLYIVRSCDFLQ